MRKFRLFLAIVAAILAQMLLTGAPALYAAGDAAAFYRPIAPWTGRLILPPPAAREEDGSVLFEVHNSPLAGKTVRLRWNLSKPEDGWFAKLRHDVTISPEKAAEAAKYSMQLPTRLDGWKRVSPLESLAGARAADDVFVALKNPVFHNGSVFINEEPVQICGSHVALVRFDGPANGNFRTVRHYDPAARAFSGPAETVSIMPFFTVPGKKDLVSTTLDIERSNFNRAGGYYIYGVPHAKGFEVMALEPRSVNSLAPSQYLGGRAETKKYIDSGHFSQMSPGMRRSTLIMPETSTPLTYSQTGGGDTAAYIGKNWPVGTYSILVHLFGWRKNTVTGESGTQALGIATGHFAFGVASVVIDPFTGEKRFDIEYKQIYAHNNTGIISGTHKWHSYMGDLKRGWMYTIPVSDTVVQLPELMPYDINGWKIDPIKGFSRVTEMMMAVYRTGGGTGASLVRPDVSCVQDSHYALYASLMVFENSVLNVPKAAEWMKNNPQNDSVRRFESLKSLARQLKDRITILGIARDDWRAHFSNPLGTRDPGKAQQIIRALLSIKSVFPRDGNDNLLHLAAERGCRMWSMLTAMSGGKAEGLWPIAPTSIVNK